MFKIFKVFLFSLRNWLRHYKNPKFCRRFWHNLHTHWSECQFFIFNLKPCKEVASCSLGRFARRNGDLFDIGSIPYFTVFLFLLGRREKGYRIWGGGTGVEVPGAHHFQEHNLFFDVKLGNINFLYVNNMWDYTLFIEQDLSDKKYLALSEFIVLAANWVTKVTKNKFVSTVLNGKIFSFFRQSTDYHP